MPCYHPIPAYQSPGGGALELYAAENAHLYRGRPGKHFHVPCGQCSGCRRKRALNMATRCVHEAQLHEFNSYITLTLDDKHLPSDLSLSHRTWQLFMKALRNALDRDANHVLSAAQHGEIEGITNDASGRRHNLRYSLAATPHRIISAIQTIRPVPPRFYMAGEYGAKYGRPHYHAILFGVDFGDKVYHGRTKAGEKIYKSETLSQIWKRGYASIGNVTFNSAAYIARYCMKKRTGDGNKQDYHIIDLETGEIHIRKKEYNNMSRNPGLAKEWWNQFKDDVIYDDQIITKDGRSIRPPRYYDKQLKRFDRAIYEHTKYVRELEALAQKEHHTPERLAVQETVAEANARFQTRNLE